MILFLGQAAIGDWDRAMGSFREALATFTSLDSELGMMMIVLSIAYVAASNEELELAARMLGKADEMAERLGGGPPWQQFLPAAFDVKVRESLGEDAFARSFEDGRRMSTHDVTAFAATYEPPPGAGPLPFPGLEDRAEGSG
jgi:hypothetical protein